MDQEGFLNEIRHRIKVALEQLITVSNLLPGQIIVVGCSTSEIQGEKIGSCSSLEIGETVFQELWSITEKRGLYLAIQCCEHLNRCLVIENECAEKYGLEIVSVVPHVKAGGSLATTAYYHFKNSVVVEEIKAHAGIDIGDTFIGMHLRFVAVPVRCKISEIGAAHLTMARTRPKLIGGERAKY
ncbi:MAG: TIGR01440 family protein [Dehalobacterium sp.]